MLFREYTGGPAKNRGNGYPHGGWDREGGDPPITLPPGRLDDSIRCHRMYLPGCRANTESGGSHPLRTGRMGFGRRVQPCQGLIFHEVLDMDAFLAGCRSGGQRHRGCRYREDVGHECHHVPVRLPSPRRGGDRALDPAPPRVVSRDGSPPAAPRRHLEKDAHPVPLLCHRACPRVHSLTSQKTKCRPAVTQQDHRWMFPSLTRVTPSCRAVPVAHPGCPVPHHRAITHRSDGDLWVRCSGTPLRWSPGRYNPFPGTSGQGHP